MCKKDGCDLSNVNNIDMIIDSNEEKKNTAAVNMGSMTPKERLQHKLEERKKANPTPPEKNTAPPLVKPEAKASPQKPQDDVPPVADAKTKAEEEDATATTGSEASEGAGKKKNKKKKAKPDAPEPAAPVDIKVPTVEVKSTADDEAVDGAGDGAVAPEGQKKKSKSKKGKQ